MEKEDFVQRIVYICDCLERIFGMHGQNPLWYIVRFGDKSSPNLPLLSLDDLKEQLYIPNEDGDPFTIFMAFSTKTAIFSLFEIAKYRLNHPYKVLSTYDECIFLETSDLLADLVHDWRTSKEQYDGGAFDIFNSSYKQRLFRTSAQKLLKLFEADVKDYKEKLGEMRSFYLEKAGERLREYWTGFSLGFNRGLYDTNRFRLYFSTERGEEATTETLLYTNYDVFEKAEMFEKGIRNLLRGIFPHVELPNTETKNGLDIFRTDQT